MKKIRHLLLPGIALVAFVLLQGCYTQLAVSHRTFVPNNSPQYVDPEEQPPEDTVVHEHYWVDYPYYHWPWYDPFFYDPGFYVDFHFVWGDPFWYPWCYRPYWSRPLYGWYDPYYPGYYSWYYAGYGYGYPYYGLYWDPFYYVDPVPKEKRDWDRRGSRVADRTVSRTSNTTGGQVAAPVVAGKSGTRAVNRGSESTSTEGVSRRGGSTERKVSRSNVRRRADGAKIVRTTKRIYQRVVKPRSSSGSVTRSSGGSKSGSVRSASGRSSGSKSQSRSSNRSSRSGSKSSGKASRSRR